MPLRVRWRGGPGECENVEEVGITTDTSMAGLDISQLGLPPPLPIS